jgi:hypothetical protein
VEGLSAFNFLLCVELQSVKGRFTDTGFCICDIASWVNLYFNTRSKFTEVGYSLRLSVYINNRDKTSWLDVS